MLWQFLVLWTCFLLACSQVQAQNERRFNVTTPFSMRMELIKKDPKDGTAIVEGMELIMFEIGDYVYFQMSTYAADKGGAKRPTRWSTRRKGLSKTGLAAFAGTSRKVKKHILRMLELLMGKLNYI